MGSQESKPTTPTTKCSLCKEPGEHTGHVYRMIPRVSIKGKERFRFKKETRQFCKTHYMENQYGLWPYRCTRACQRARRAASEILLRPEQLVVWIGMEVILGRGNHPNCPWCGKAMKSAHPLGDKPR
jgi:hypothetical protein